MANVQSALSAPPFVGLLTVFGSSQDQYLIEHSQCALAASRQCDTLRYQRASASWCWAAEGEAVWLGPAPPNKCSVQVPGTWLSSSFRGCLVLREQVCGPGPE